MHPHLHQEYNAGCAEVMAAFEECHAKGFLWKTMGMCNSAKDALGKCLREERTKHQSTNRSNAQDKKDKIRAMWKDIDENS